MERTNLSAYAFRFGLLAGRRRGFTPESLNSPRTASVNSGSRSWNVPLWVWEREPSGKSNPEWTPVNKRAFVKGIVWSLYTYNDSNCNLPQKKMIDHVNTMLHSFHVGGLPRGWNQHRQATDQEAWRACYSPEDGDMVFGLSLDDLRRFRRSFR